MVINYIACIMRFFYPNYMYCFMSIANGCEFQSLA